MDSHQTKNNDIVVKILNVLVALLFSIIPIGRRTKEVKQKIIEMSQNGSGIRDTARVLNVSQTTVIKELKKAVRPR